MKAIGTIFLKELKRFFTDPRMLFALFLPGVMMYAIYSLMGNFFGKAVTSNTPKDTTFQVAYTDNSGNDTPTLISNLTLVIVKTENTNSLSGHKVSSDDATVTMTKADVEKGTYDLFVVFSTDFEKNITAGKTGNNVSIYYNGASENAAYCYSLTTALIPTTYNGYTQNIVNGSYSNPLLGKTDASSQKIIGFIVPIVTISLLFSAVISICPEAIAGEKERGTLSSLLLTPIRRSDLAIGKILAISVIAIASGIDSFLGLYLSLPNLLQGFSIAFTATEVFSLFLVIISALLLFVSIGTIISALAKSIREASSYLAPIMTIALGIAILPGLMDLSAIGYAFVPLLNIGSSMYLIITGNASIGYLLATFGTNVALSLALVFVIAKIFANENLMLRK
jgi:sodium transport system permease protein